VKRLKLLKQEITKVRRKLGSGLKSTSGLAGNDESLETEALSLSNKKSCAEEFSTPGNARRLRAGKEIEIPPGISKSGKSLNQGKKREIHPEVSHLTVNNPTKKYLQNVPITMMVQIRHLDQHYYPVQLSLQPA